MAKKEDEFNFHALDAIVKDFLCAYKLLCRQGSKLTQEAPGEKTASTPHVSMQAKLVTTPRGSQHDIPIPMTPRSEDPEAMVLDGMQCELPQALQASARQALRSKGVVPKPLSPRFAELEAEVAEQLERELPRLADEKFELDGDCEMVYSSSIQSGSEECDPGVPRHSLGIVAHAKSLLSAFSSFQQKRPSTFGQYNRAAKSKNLQSVLTKANEESFQLSHTATTFTPSLMHCTLYFQQSWQRCIDTPKRQLLAKNLDSAMGVVIVVNCILTAASLDTDDWNGWYFIECFFVGLYTIEICLKVALFGWKEVYFGASWCWSMLDTLIVILALVDLVSQFSGSITTFRVLRLLRLSRLIRLTNRPMLRELNMLVRGMIAGARCLFWCIIFLSLPMLIIGMILSQVLKGWEDQLFSSVPASMFTTLRCMCSDCTDNQGRPIFLLIANKRGWSFALFYSIFILVTMFGVFNLITAIFIETTMLAAKSDSGLQRQLRQADDRKFARNIRKLVFRFWIAHSDKLAEKPCRSSNRTSMQCKEFSDFVLDDALDLEIDQDFYQQQVKTPDIREVLDDLGLPDEDIVDLFDMLDVDRSGTLDLAELVSGLHKLRGDARKHDLVGLAYIIFSAQESIIREINKRVGCLRDAGGTPQASGSRLSVS